MQELSANKKMKVMKLYLSGYSFNEVAKKAGVGRGSITNIISDLKEGLFPEISTIAEEIEQLRDLAISIKHSGLSPIQANIGLSVLEKLGSLGIEPTEIEKCHTLLQALSSPDKDLAVMAKSILAIEEVKQNTGLSLEELEAKVVSLRQESEQLAPISEEIEIRKKELAQLETNRNSLMGKIKELNDRDIILSGSVNSLEVKEVQLLNHTAELEERARAADKQLSEARRDLKALDKIGMSVQELNRFTVKLKEVSAHHDIKPEELYRRLLKELGMLDKGLNLGYKVKETKAQLEKVRNEIIKEQAEKEGLHSYLNQLISEKTKLEAQLAQYRKQLAHDISALSSASKETMREINDSLKSGIETCLSEINKLAEEALRVGKEVGKMEASIESSNWIKPLLSMVRGDNGLDDYQVRAIGLSVLRSILSWLNENRGQDIDLYLLINNMQSTITELEKWKS